MPRSFQTAVTPAADGAAIHWRRYAADRPHGRVLLIHALAMDAANWDGVAAALPADLDVIALDCRGHGASQAGLGDFTLAQFADDAAAVMDAAGWTSAVIVGCSMGGCVAQALAARHPARAAGLVLVDTTAWYGPDGAAAWAARADKAQAEGLASLLEFQRSRWFSGGFLKAHPDRVAAVEAVFLANDLSAYRRTCAMLGTADLRASTAALDLPAAIIVGAEDYATPPAAARALADAIPGATLDILEGARHFTPIERPEAIAAAISRIAAAASAGVAR